MAYFGVLALKQLRVANHSDVEWVHSSELILGRLLLARDRCHHNLVRHVKDALSLGLLPRHRLVTTLIYKFGLRIQLLLQYFPSLSVVDAIRCQIGVEHLSVDPTLRTGSLSHGLLLQLPSDLLVLG
jgi:hypothetical protein